MDVNNYKGKVMAALIQIDVEENCPNKSRYNRKFPVYYKENIEEIRNSIEKIGKEHEIPITRTYISGHTLISPSDLCTKEQIENIYKVSPYSDINETQVSIKR